MTKAQELERLVVRFMGEAGNYEKVLDDVLKDTKQATDELDKLTDQAMAEQKAMMKESARLTEALKTPTEQYADQVKHLEKLYASGHITAETYGRALRHATDQLPSVRDAQARYNEEVAKGKAIMRNYETATNRYQRELDELNTLHRKGMISTKAHAAEVDRLAREHNQGRFAAARYGRQMQAVGSTLRNTGAIMTLTVTAPIIGMGLAMVRAGSDSEETAQKFGVVFRGVSAEAKAMVKDLDENFGLSGSSAQKLLGDTGDLLTGFGFAQDSALDLSGEVQKLAVDLAAFTNIEGGAERASRALTKALLGEREMAKELGIAILEKDVLERVALNTARGMEFATTRQAKAYATLQLAQEQSKNAMGAYAREAESVSNQTRELAQDAKSAAGAWGKLLQPAMRGVLRVTRGLVKWLENLDTSWKLAIITAGAVVAVVGPLLGMLGMGVLIAGQLTTALAALTVAQVAFAKSLAVGLLGLTNWVLIGAAAGAAAYTLGVKLRELELFGTDWLAEYNKELERHNTLTAQSIKLIEKRRMGEVQDLQAIEDPKKKRAAIEDAIKMAKVEADANRAALRDAKGNVDEYSTAWRRFRGNKVLAQLKTQMDEVGQKSENSTAHLKRLQELLQKLDKDGGSVKLGNDIDKLTLELENEAKAFGKTGAAAKVYALELRGATAEQLAAANAAAARIDTLEKEQKIRDLLQENYKRQDQVGLDAAQLRLYELNALGATEAEMGLARAQEATLKVSERLADSKKLTKSLEDQVTFFGMTSREADIYRMVLRGATNDELAAARAFDKRLTMMEAEKKLTSEAADLTKRMRTPLQKLTDTRSELDAMLKRNLITLDTYNAAIGEATKEYNKEITVDVKFRTHGIDGVLAGTAEAEARLIAFHERRAEAARLGRAPGAAVPGVPRVTEPGPTNEKGERDAMVNVLAMIEENTRKDDFVEFEIKMPGLEAG